jgi:hypothetical protein
MLINLTLFLKSINTIDQIIFWQFWKSVIQIALAIIKYFQLTKLLNYNQLFEFIAIQILKQTLYWTN